MLHVHVTDKMFVFTASGYNPASWSFGQGQDHWLSGSWFIDH